jgi:phage recombination protein Bet
MNNTQITTASKPASALGLMAERCNVEPGKLHSTLKNTVFKGATDDELLALVVTANTYELNPLLKELYAFPKKGGGITPMVGVDGWLKIANRQPNFDGLEVEVYGDGKTPTHATCEIFLKDRAHSVKITEYFEECKRNTDPWNQMPRRMIRNKAIIQAIRVAFGIGGIHDEDEAMDITEAKPRNVTPRPAADAVVIDPFKAEDAKPDPKPAKAPKPDPTPEPEEVPEEMWGNEAPAQEADEIIV